MSIHHHHQARHPLSHHGLQQCPFSPSDAKSYFAWPSSSAVFQLDLLAFPNEIILCIADSLETRDLDSLLRTNRHLYTLLNPWLIQRAWYSDKYLSAVAKGPASVIRLLLRSCTEIEPEDWITALVTGAEHGCEPVVRVVLERGAEVDGVDSSGTTALLTAVEYGHGSVVRALLEGGAKVDRVDSSGNTALLTAVKWGNESVVQALLEGGAEIDREDPKGNTVLRVAAFHGNESAVQALLEGGAEIDREGPDGNTAFQCAVEEFFNNTPKEPYESIIRLFLQKGANINHLHYSTALHYAIAGFARHHTPHSAACDDHIYLIQLLLEHGADFTITDGDGLNALHYAAQHDNTSEVIKLLLRAGADPYAPCAVLSHKRTQEQEGKAVGERVNVQATEGRTAIGISVMFRRIMPIRVLVEEGIDINARDANGESALHIAQSCGCVSPGDKMLEVIIDSGFDINDKDPIIQPLLVAMRTQNFSALHTAARHGRIDAMEVLLESGVDPACINTRIQHWPYCQLVLDQRPLHCAAMYGQEAAVQLLLEEGVDINHIDIHRNSALHSAVKTPWGVPNLSMIRLLLNNGVNVRARNADGYTALNLVLSRMRQRVVNEALGALVPKFQWEVGIIKLLIETQEALYSDYNTTYP